jgi:antitoxin component of RelBE/YafQ-DinJ toxin-antitoxin module
MAEMPSIGKGDRASAAQGGYAYRGIEAITGHVQVLLAKHGVVIVPNARLISMSPAPGMKETWSDVILEVEWTITGPDGSTMTGQTIGIGRDSADKGANKAMTQAYKYLLLDLLCIADKGDDSDGADYSHYERSEPVKTAGQLLAERLHLPMSEATKSILTQMRDTRELALTAAAFDANKTWLQEVKAVLDGSPRERG